MLDPNLMLYYDFFYTLSYYPGPGINAFILVSSVVYLFPIENANFVSCFSGLYYPGPGRSIVAFRSCFGLTPILKPPWSIAFK